MPYSYQYNAETNIIDSCWTGIFSVKDIHEYLTAVLADDRIQPDFIEIVNIEAVENLIVRYSETAPFEDIWKRFHDKGCTATIIYAPTDKSYGTFRMLKSVVESRNENLPQDFIVVRTKEEIAKQIKSIRS